MQFPVAMMHEQVWFDRTKYEEAVESYQLFLCKNSNTTLELSKKTEAEAAGSAISPLVNEIAKARENIRQTLSDVVVTTPTANSTSEVAELRNENKQLKTLVSELAGKLEALTLRVGKLEGGSTKSETISPAAAKKTTENKDDDDSDFDFFDDEEEEEDTEEEKQKKEQLIAAYNAKKGKKAAVIAKSAILLDVKPWDDETDLKEMERLVRTIKLDGLVWGAQAKLVPLAYGIKKLQIPCVVEDDKVGTDILEEEITKFEDMVQSVDIAAFNKI